MKKVKVAIIGHGHLGKWHAQKADQLEITLAWELNGHFNQAGDATKSVADHDAATDAVDPAAPVHACRT